jgi:large subunit ribosomal protein L35
VPKLKTHKGAAARFKVTGTGKLRRMKGHRSHLRRKKPASVRRLYSRKMEVSLGDAPRVKRLIPYAKS